MSTKLSRAAAARRNTLQETVAAVGADTGGSENNKLFGISADFPRLMELDVDKCHPDPNQPRRVFKPGSIEEMGESIRTKGQLQPILARPHPDLPGEYMIVFGERRWRGHKHISKPTIFAIVRNITNVREIQLVENIQREDLTPFETARSYADLQKEFGYSQRDLADAVNKSQPEVQCVLSFLSLPEAIIAEYESDPDLADRVSKSQLAEIAAEPDQARRLVLWEAAKGGATVNSCASSASIRRRIRRPSTGRRSWCASPALCRRRRSMWASCRRSASHWASRSALSCWSCARRSTRCWRRRAASHED